MNLDLIQITKRTFPHREPEYQAYCVRCQRHVGSERTHVWASKAPAVRWGKEHLEGHTRLAAWRIWVMERDAATLRVVDTITQQD